MNPKLSLNQMLTPIREEDLRSFYEEIMGKEAPDSESSENKPYFVQAADTRAAELGISTEQLLSGYSEQLRYSAYPTAECLTPDEIQVFVSGSPLSVPQEQHLSACEGCAKLLMAAQPPAKVVLALSEDVRLMGAHVSGRAHALADSKQWNTSTASTVRSAALFSK